MTTFRVQVMPYRWDRGTPAETPGAKIQTGKGMTFIPLDQLHDTADALVDLAEALEDQGAEQ